MFFFYPIHYKNHAKLPAVDAQSHLLVTNQPLPVSLILLAAMNVLNNHHRIFIFENQWVIVNKIFYSVIQIIVKKVVINLLFSFVEDFSTTLHFVSFRSK